MPVRRNLPTKKSCLVFSCKVSIPDPRFKKNHPHYIGLREHRPYKHNNSFNYKSKRNSTELSSFIWGKKKEKINVDLDWSILDKAKPYSPASKKKCMLCLTEKYHIIFFCITIVLQFLKVFHNYRLRIAT